MARNALNEMIELRNAGERALDGRVSARLFSMLVHEILNLGKIWNTVPMGEGYLVESLTKDRRSVVEEVIDNGTMFVPS